MPAAPRPATPDMMTLLCLISGAMREAGPSGLWLHFLLIGALCPSFGMLLKTWLYVQEHLDGADWVDADDECGERSGWLSQTGRVWRWREVTSSGIVLVIPYRWFVAFRNAARLKRGRVWSPLWSMTPPSAKNIFLPVLATVKNCVLIVTISKRIASPLERPMAFGATPHPTHHGRPRPAIQAFSIAVPR